VSDAWNTAIAAVAGAALELVADGASIGLGTGRAASAFIALLGERVEQGLRVSAVATSAESARLASQWRIPLIDLSEELRLDLTVDGADEVAPNLDLIKGWGGALVRERIVAAASRRQVILVGRDKLVNLLGQRGRLPVEVIPFASGAVLRALRTMGLAPGIRAAPDGGGPYRTDNGNLILDCALPAPLPDPTAARGLEARLLALAGVVDTGLFLGTASLVLVGSADGGVEARHRSTETHA
jgi:ribose 5-phosphate isomerase A